VFGSLFRKRKSNRSSSDVPQTIDSVRTATVGDVVVIRGFSPTLEDAYIVIHQLNRYESSRGEWYDLIGSDGERSLTVEWHDEYGQTLFVCVQEAPMALSAVNLTEAELVRIDEEHSLDNHIEYKGEWFFYRNSYEAFRFAENGDDGAGFFLWEFFTRNGDGLISVVKEEESPFEVYISEALSPELVSVFKK